MADPNQSTVGLRYYTGILWRHKWIVLQAVIIIPAIVVGVSLTRPTMYSATARVMAVSQSPSVSVAVGSNVDLSAPDERELQTLASFVVTPEIADEVSAELGWPEDSQVLMEVTKAEADPSANIIAVTAERPTPQEAADLANAFAAGFVLWRKDTQQKSLDEAIKLLDEQIALTPNGSAAQSALVERRGQLEVLQTLVTGGLTIGEAAQPPDSPSSPKPLRNGVLAFAAALVLGVGLAFVRESLDVHLHSAEEVAALTDLPLIAAIPEQLKKEKGRDVLAGLGDPRGPVAEAYRFLRTNLDFLNFNHDIKVVLVTSPLAGQGKSTIIANLAIALMRAGKRVSVVEGDLRRPSLHRRFEIANDRGITDVVSGATPLSAAVHVLTLVDKPVGEPTADDRTGADGTDGQPHAADDFKLRVLLAGPLPPNPGEIVNSRQLGHIIEMLKSESDYVLVDTPPMLVVGDAAAMAARVDGIIVVLRLAETTADTVKNVEDFLERVPARALGIVVSGVPRRSKGNSYRY